MIVLGIRLASSSTTHKAGLNSDLSVGIKRGKGDHHGGGITFASIHFTSLLDMSLPAYVWGQAQATFLLLMKLLYD